MKLNPHKFNTRKLILAKINLLNPISDVGGSKNVPRWHFDQTSNLAQAEGLCFSDF